MTPLDLADDALELVRVENFNDRHPEDVTPSDRRRQSLRRLRLLDDHVVSPSGPAQAARRSSGVR